MSASESPAVPTHAVVISGKGGTGKTTVTGAFASLAGRLVLADADVDASNLPLLLEPKIVREEIFSSRGPAEIDQELCRRCGMCLPLCRFGAIEMQGDDPRTASFVIDPLACEGCNLCVRACPFDAIRSTTDESGRWFVSETRFGPLVHARLGTGQENSGRLVSIVREEAARLAARDGRRRILIDGPPGIGCPAISALTGVDVALVVVEPSLSSLHDMERVLVLARQFDVAAAVAVNKADLDPEGVRRIRESAREAGAEVLGEIPFDPAVVDSVRAGRPLPEAAPDAAATGAVAAVWKAFRDFWDGAL